VLVVAGYSGGEEGVMYLLKEAAKQFENLVIYWTMYEETPSESAQQLLSIGNNKFIIPNCDADELFAQIMEGLGIGIPKWMENPTSSLIALSENFAPSKNQDIQIKIQTYQTKIQQLREPPTEVVDESISPLDRVATLRLEGRHEEALEILRPMQAENSPEVWRMLAESAYELGQLSSDPDLMRESISSWEKAIELVSKEESPDVWYALQIGLGKSLQFLSDLDPDKQHLTDAVAAYTAASEEKSHEIVPRDWADAQNNLGIALQKLGEIEHNEAHLEKAVEAHRAAVSEYDRKRAPLNWAESQSNLGGALQTLGELRKDHKLIEEAAAAYRMALKEYTRGRVPLDWAETESNLGGALNVLYDYTKDLSLLDEAATAYRSAIDVPASESTGVNRAEAQSGLGDVLFKLGKQQSDISVLQDAAAAYKSSAEYYRESGDLEESQVIEEKLEQVRNLISELESPGQDG
jgi:tetratricopeptide (TPR) repeat protein